jgi:hypothetical protein
MSDNPYEKDCMYCKQKITMSKETGKWLPYNSDESAHDCRTKNGNAKTPQSASQQKLTEVDQKAVIKTVLARLDGIKQDLERLIVS